MAIIPQTQKDQERREEFRRILQAWVDFYKEPTQILVDHLRNRHEYTYRDIGEVLGVTKQNVIALYGRKNG